MSDGHDTSCTYRKCAHPESPEPCPFLKEQTMPMELGKPYKLNECKHEWRIMGEDAYRDIWFYCIHCRKVEKHTRT